MIIDLTIGPDQGQGRRGLGIITVKDLIAGHLVHGPEIKDHPGIDPNPGNREESVEDLEAETRKEGGEAAAEARKGIPKKKKGKGIFWVKRCED